MFSFPALHSCQSSDQCLPVGLTLHLPFSFPELVLHVRAMSLHPALCLRTSLNILFAHSCSSVKIRANQHFARKTTFQTIAYLHLRQCICQDPHQARRCTSHTHAPTRPPVHPAMPSTRHLSLTSQLTNNPPAHMQPGIHQSRPPPNVLRSSHYHLNQNTLTSQLKHPPHTCHPCLTNPTLPPTSLVYLPLNLRYLVAGRRVLSAATTQGASEYIRPEKL